MNPGGSNQPTTTVQFTSNINNQPITILQPSQLQPTGQPIYYQLVNPQVVQQQQQQFSVIGVQGLYPYGLVPGALKPAPTLPNYQVGAISNKHC